MVVASDGMAAAVGRDVLQAGGTAVDAAVATAFALAVTFPAAGNIGGGGFLVHRAADGAAVAYDFRETAPAASSPEMFLVGGVYDAERHHNSHVAVGVPGSVAGLHRAWSDHGRLPWRRLVEPAIALARDGFVLSYARAASLAGALVRMAPYPASIAAFSRDGIPYAAGERLRQSDLAGTLELIADEGPDGFYRGRTAALLAREMAEQGGLITEADLAAYVPRVREPIRGEYRGYEVLSMPPPSSGGVTLVQMLNVLEGYDLGGAGYGSALNVHRIAEAMRRGFADRARHLGDPDFNPVMPLLRLTSKEYAAGLRATIDADRASRSAPDTFEWPAAGNETTHISVVDADRNAVSLTTTLEQSYGSKIVVPGAGFLLNNEMGDFNAAPGLTTATGLIGTQPNLAEPGKRMLSSMTPTIVTKDGRLFMVTGSPGGRTIINTVLHTILNVIDFGMNVQEAVDAPRFHHQWLPDELRYERRGLSPDTLALLEARGHSLAARASQGAAHAIVLAEADVLEGAADPRRADAAAVGY
jgi:gamma-glutamyltranspeptidase/glutathione hydrolase